MWSFTKRAKGTVKSRPLAMIAGILRFIPMMMRVRINGDYRRTPFFAADTGAPVAAPKILSAGEREAVLAAAAAP
jgi:hypothetical protein